MIINKTAPFRGSADIQAQLPAGTSLDERTNQIIITFPAAVTAIQKANVLTAIKQYFPAASEDASTAGTTN